MHFCKQVCVPPTSKRHHWGISKEEGKKTANCMSTNVKEAPNNSLCKAHCRFGLQLWSSLSLSCSWSQVTDVEEGHTVGSWTLNTFLHGLTITLRCVCACACVRVCLSVCVYVCARRHSSLLLSYWWHILKRLKWCTLKYSAVFPLIESLR